MYIDAFLLVSDSQAVTVTAVSTHTIDLSNVTPKRDVSVGEPLGFGVGVDVAAVADITLEAVESDNADLSSPTVISSVVRTMAQLTAGSLHFVPLGTVSKRYIGMRYTTGGTGATLSAWLTPRDLFSKLQTYYARNYAV